MKIESGKKYDFTLKPSTLIGWTVVSENDKGFVISKTSYFKCAKGKPYHHESFLSKKRIMKVIPNDEP